MPCQWNQSGRECVDRTDSSRAAGDVRRGKCTPRTLRMRMPAKNFYDMRQKARNTTARTDHTRHSRDINLAANFSQLCRVLLCSIWEIMFATFSLLFTFLTYSFRSSRELYLPAIIIKFAQATNGFGFSHDDKHTPHHFPQKSLNTFFFSSLLDTQRSWKKIKQINKILHNNNSEQLLINWWKTITF